MSSARRVAWAASAIVALAPAAAMARRHASRGVDPVRAAAALAARLDQCPSLDERRRGGAAYVRFEVTPEGVLSRARLVDVGTGGELADDCARAALPDAPISPAGPLVSVWWPLASSTPRFGAPTRVQVPGVDLLVVPRAYPRSALPKALKHKGWLGLCGRKTKRAVPRAVRLGQSPNADDDDFDDVSLEGCGADPAEVPALRGPALRAGAKPAHIEARPRRASVRFHGERHRLWQVRRDGQPPVLALAVGATIQVLATDEDPEWPAFTLVWAGDLDRDGRLDLLVRDGEPDVGRYRLFLSHAQRTLPVLLAAELDSPGD